MIKVKRSLIAASAALGFALISNVAQADTYSSFWFAADGVAADAVLIRGTNGFNIGGEVMVSDTFTSATDFSFTQYGYDSLFNGYPDSVRISGTGTGSTATGALNFNGGIVDFLNASKQVIAEFNVTNGSASLPTGSVVPSGLVSLQATAATMQAGYFFQDLNGVKGADFSTFEAGKPVFALSSTTFNPIGNVGNGSSDLADLTSFAHDISGYFPGGTDGFSTTFVTAPNVVNLVGNTGGNLYVEIPEPESLALMGLGLVALAASRRRKQAK
jgi:hypothetical protein